MVRIEFDIDIPKNCRECPFSKHHINQLRTAQWWSCYFCGYVGYGLKRDENCPLKEVEDDKS